MSVILGDPPRTDIQVLRYGVQSQAGWIKDTIRTCAVVTALRRSLNNLSFSRRTSNGHVSDQVIYSMMGDWPALETSFNNNSQDNRQRPNNLNVKYHFSGIKLI